MKSQRKPALPDPREVAHSLASERRPFLIGVRHHSPACAAAMPALLQACKPTCLAVELPSDLQEWIPWLVHSETMPPVALAGATSQGEILGFYPFAEFSPEWTAMRWAAEHDVRIIAIDRPLGLREPKPAAPNPAPPGDPRLLPRVMAHVDVRDDESLWDELVEARADGDAEPLRVAALLYGWMVRHDHELAADIAASDLLRERHMRWHISRAVERGECVVAVVGAFHAPVLAAPEPKETVEDEQARPIVPSLVPYAHELLDSRSGYPAGIRDPEWQRAMLHALRAANPGDARAQWVGECAVAVTRALRKQGHVAGTAHAQAICSLSQGLARVRGLPAPGRREFVEACQSVLAQGEVYGLGRAVAQALEKVLVGKARGRLPEATPQCGLRSDIVRLLADLRLPGPDAAEREGKDLRLTPLDSHLDRRRHVALCRLAVCGIPYARRITESAAGGLDALGERWLVRWDHACDAVVEVAALRGVVLEQAAYGALRADWQRHRESPLAEQLNILRAAAEAGLAELVGELACDIAQTTIAQARLGDIVWIADFAERIARGHIAGLLETATKLPQEFSPEALLQRGIRALEGCAGSNDAKDACALADWVARLRDENYAIGDGALAAVLRDITRGGSDLMQGAAWAALVLLQVVPGAEVGLLIAGWYEAATAAEGQRILAQRLRGVGYGNAAWLEERAAWGALDSRMLQHSDDSFLARCPALRDAFEALSTAQRARVLSEVLAVHSESASAGELAHSAELLMEWSVMDALGYEKACALDARWRELEGSPAADRCTTPQTRHAVESLTRTGDSEYRIRHVDRWRLVLGSEREKLAHDAARCARSLDELYGQGHGEGSAFAEGGGQGAAFPSAREWHAEIEALFGATVFEEVSARAAEAGRAAALLEGDTLPNPSVELLTAVLSLRGGLPEAHMSRLRRIVAHAVEHITKELLLRVRPALVGRPHVAPARRGHRLHLPATIRGNLHRAQAQPEGGFVIVPERPWFRARARKRMEWHVFLVVDTSGSMEASVVYSALMAAIIASLPWVSVSFLAFDTEVVDLSLHASDPLALLLEVRMGGGTDIAKGLAYARRRIKHPARTILLCLSDFEDGGSLNRLLGECRAAVESGITVLGLAALDDRGAPRYSKATGELIAGCGVPIAALTPLELARWLGERMR